MGKFNEIIPETTQSYGDNAFTTTIKSSAVEFDSAKDQFKFLDPVDVPELTINGESVVPGGGGLKPDERGNYNMGNENNVMPGNNGVIIGAPSAKAVQNALAGSNNLIVGSKNATLDGSGANVVIGYDNTADASTRGLISGEGNRLKGISQASIAGSSNTVEGQYSATVGSSNCTVTGSHTVAIGCINTEANLSNMVYVPGIVNQSQTEILKDGGDGVTTYYNKKKIYTKHSIQGGSSITLAFSQNANQTLIIDLKYCVKTAQGSTATASIRQGSTSQDIETLTVDGEWHSILVEPNVPNTNYTFWTENGIEGDEVSLIVETYANTNH